MTAISNETPTLIPHLVCAGAADAIEFYKQAFGAEERMRLPAPDGRLIHGRDPFGHCWSIAHPLRATVMSEDELREAAKQAQCEAVEPAAA